MQLENLKPSIVIPKNRNSSTSYYSSFSAESNSAMSSKMIDQFLPNLNVSKSTATTLIMEEKRIDSKVFYNNKNKEIFNKQIESILTTGKNGQKLQSLKFIASNSKCQITQSELIIIADKFKRNITFDRSSTNGYSYHCIYKNLLCDIRKQIILQFKQWKKANHCNFQFKNVMLKDKFYPH